MTHVAYVLGGYAVTAAALVGYAAWVRAKARSLAALLPDPSPAGPAQPGPSQAGPSQAGPSQARS